MKKYVYALAAFLTLGFAACSSDDDEDNSIDTDVPDCIGRDFFV